jgi:TM2 domain-containing membrane protein YozV
MTNSTNIPAVAASASQVSGPTRLMQYDTAKKSPGFAYLLWFFFGSLGVHRFYLNQPDLGLVMLTLFILSWATTFVVIGFFGLCILALWWLVDAFLIPGITARANIELAAQRGSLR